MAFHNLALVARLCASHSLNKSLISCLDMPLVLCSDANWSSKITFKAEDLNWDDVERGSDNPYEVEGGRVTPIQAYWSKALAATMLNSPSMTKLWTKEQIEKFRAAAEREDWTTCEELMTIAQEKAKEEE